MSITKKAVELLDKAHAAATAAAAIQGEHPDEAMRGQAAEHYARALESCRILAGLAQAELHLASVAMQVKALAIQEDQLLLMQRADERQTFKSVPPPPR
jgi:hypothetical protein